MIWRRWQERRQARRAIREAADRLYAAVVAQARQPGFYTVCGVADTLDGRFDMIALHATLVMHRLKGRGAAAGVVSQALYDRLFVDMDQSLREMGVGDMSIARKVKRMSAAFSGRLAAYDAALSETIDGPLSDVLFRNLYRSAESVSAEQVARVAAYARQSVRHLETQPLDALLAGEVDFPAAPEA
ncbi:ubiquinol-cytochrome C chaperone family protein [Roseospirillum parvum]|uniref:Cytochrome b pre-mRNA-processing protein 3 n=1 Tax=Roseospirillum parvum TaxID=83401 RepID=A0A1G7YCL5_9PROT|nr:ubiquinol-cytochrome C chaperone family protein [Roseospirillum parvum]SDG94083.1 cytochrome b pre-mRNA-processing protein 3 [Roseospirillum parvum]